ncbi:MAG: guanylate kinase [Gammaproteobacteria bacterium]
MAQAHSSSTGAGASRNSRASTLYVVSAPSGAGKTSLLHALVDADPALRLSTSHTTRALRPGERDGEHYHFIDQTSFESLISQNGFLEHALVFDHYYGTAKAGVERDEAEGYDVILESDWQGARQVRAKRPDAVSIFILPPSQAALKERLSVRGQDSAKVIARRMHEARDQMSHFDEYDYIVFNDDFKTALGELRSIFVARRMRLAAQRARNEALLKALCS